MKKTKIRVRFSGKNANIADSITKEYTTEMELLDASYKNISKELNKKYKDIDKITILYITPSNWRTK
jgi:hypothetical protein